MVLGCILVRKAEGEANNSRSQIPLGDTWEYFATGERIIPTFKWYLVPEREYLSDT